MLMTLVSDSPFSKNNPPKKVKIAKKLILSKLVKIIHLFVLRLQLKTNCILIEHFNSK